MSVPEAPARLSIREFAKRAGCDEKQVRRAIENGRLSKGNDGLLASADVDGQWRKPNRRGIVKMAADKVRTSQNVRTDKVVRTNETIAEAAERIVAAQPLLSLDEAMRLKENYLGRIKQLEYDTKAGTVHVSSMCVAAVGKEYARVRTKILAIPAEQAPALFRCQTVAEIEDLMRGVLIEALEALTLDEPAAGN